MRLVSWVLTGAATSILLASWTTTVELANSAPSFSSVQSLTNVAIDLDQAVGDSKIYFTMTLPQGSNFAMLSFTEQYRDQGAELIQFDFSGTEAFIGTPEAMQQAIGIAAWMDETGTFWVEFDRPLPPATTLTVAFEVQPPSTGAYEYGVAAYPATDTPVAVLVGNGTLTIR